MSQRIASILAVLFIAGVVAFPANAGAEPGGAAIREIPSSREFIAGGSGACPVIGERFRVDSQSGEGSVGYAEILLPDCRDAKTWKGRLRLITQDGNSLIRAGDAVIAEKDGDFPGRYDLLLNGTVRSAKYKPLTYLGLIGETAETLNKGEILVDVASRIYLGVSDRFNVSALSLAEFAYPNLSMKYKVWSHPWSTLSLGSALVGTSYDSTEGLHLYSAGLSLYYDAKSNEKMISHTVITVATPPEVFRKITHPGDVLGSLTSSIRTGQQYIFDNWDRLIFGPQYLFETRAVGGYLAYIFVWDTFHLSLNLNIYDLTKLKFGTDGYVPHVFGFWRF